MSHKKTFFAIGTAILSLSALLFAKQSDVVPLTPHLVKASSHILSETAPSYEPDVQVNADYVSSQIATAQTPVIPTSLPVTSKPVVNTTAPAAQPAAPSQPTSPVRLTIPAIGINAPVLSMGLTDDGKMAVPDNFTEIGWYKLGTTPGNVGSAVMGAHVDNGGRIAGVFKNLKNLNVGDSLYVTDANGQKQEFRIVEKKVYDYRHQDTAEVFGAVGNKKRLNLITCHGTFMPSLNTYDQRLIVFAELVE